MLTLTDKAPTGRRFPRRSTLAAAFPRFATVSSFSAFSSFAFAFALTFALLECIQLGISSLVPLVLLLLLLLRPLGGPNISPGLLLVAPLLSVVLVCSQADSGATSFYISL